MYTGPILVDLLAQQHQNRHQQQNLFQQGKFTIVWRAKVGSYPHPDGETIVSAAEPCGYWKHDNSQKLNVGDNYQEFPELPLYGYIPGSSLRGIVRNWAKKMGKDKTEIRDLLGNQEEQENKIYPGKIQFLDAYPQQPQKLTLDIVNPQEDFQVYHQGQSKPLSFYTLGNGEQPITVNIAIRGIPPQATPEDVAKVWEWLQQAIVFYGIGSRTASGYGSIKVNQLKLKTPPNHLSKQLSFHLYSQGSAGVNPRGTELRPSHWRGWLRSWVLRFLLGVMSQENAEKTLGELFGSIGDEKKSESQQGCIRLKLNPGNTWGEKSQSQPSFYLWKGKLELIGPKEVINDIIIPIIRFAVSLGGVGRGWRRPLHIFSYKNGQPAARGTYLKMTHQVRDKNTKEMTTKNLVLHPNKSTIWQDLYNKWLNKVEEKWRPRINKEINQSLEAEIFSPYTCSIYTLPGPDEEPVNFQNLNWDITKNEETRGDAVDLIYSSQKPRNYKNNPSVGGSAGGGSANCSWVSIRRVNLKNAEYETDCQETVCLFLGGKTPKEDHIRIQFLKDLERSEGNTYLFGVRP